MLLSEVIADYIRHIRYERGHSAKTVESYSSWLNNLLAWMRENGYSQPLLTDFTIPLLRRFFYFQAGKGLRPRTLWSIFHPLRGMGDYLVQQGAMAENPARAVTLPKKDAAKRLTVTDAEIALLIEGCERLATPKRVALARAALGIFIYCGLRRQECLDLRVADVDLQGKWVLVRCGKGSKSRKVPLCAPIADALREWLAQRPEDTLHDWLWAYDRRRRLHDNGLNALLNEAKSAAGLRDHENICPHSLRHAAATRLLRNGANLRDIQAFLGHSMLNTTAVYLHSSEEQLQTISELTALRPQENKDTSKNLMARVQDPHRRSRRIARV